MSYCNSENKILSTNEPIDPKIYGEKDLPDYDNFPNNGNLIQINSLSYTDKIKSSGMHVLRSKGRNDYHLLYATSGKTDIVENGVATPMPLHTVRLYLPNERQEYIKYYGRTYWVHFSGYLLPEICNKLYLYEHRLFRPSDVKEFESIFDRAAALYVAKAPNYEIVCAALVMQLLSMLVVTDDADKPSAKNSSHKELIYNAIRFMQTNIREPFSIKKYAKLCAMSESRFSTLFKEIVGTSPLRFFTRIKLEQAHYLLSDTTVSVKEIATQIGFDDEFYFSRLFHKYNGVSPTQFRNMHKKS